MNSSKRSTIAILVIIAIIIVAAIVWFGRSSSNAPSPTPSDAEGSSTPPAIVSETTKVSGTLSEYQNAELGFSVKYPSSWQKEEGNAGVTFVIPLDKSQVSTVATLQVSIQVTGGTCAFPPVTTVKERSTVKSGDNSFNMISMTNTVKGLDYWNRMYSLQHGDVCYIFSFASITTDPAKKGLTGSNATQAQNNNKAIVTASDGAFTTMVKSFAFVVGPQGVDETKASPVKK